MVGRDKSQRRADNLVAFLPSEGLLEQPHREVEAAGCRIEKMGMVEAGVLLPGLFEGNGLEAKSGPTLLETFPDFAQGFIDPESRDEKVNWFVHTEDPDLVSASL